MSWEQRAREAGYIYTTGGGGGGGGDFDDCLKKFESAAQHMRDMQSALGRRVAKLRDLKSQFPSDEK